MSSYADFLAAKATRPQLLGHRVEREDIHPFLHDWQAEVVQLDVARGRAAMWEDTGLGKTIQSLEWARLSGDTALIVAPLAVCQQTARIEAPKLDRFGDVRYADLLSAG